MTETARLYLAALETALEGAPTRIRAEIIAGIREELDGLSEQKADARIVQLGDPTAIAAALMKETPTDSPLRTPGMIAVLVMIAGSVLLPVVGGVIGLAWVSWSKAWSRTEKLVAWAAPVFIAITVGALSLAVNSAHLGVLILVAVLFADGLVLLVRAHRRRWQTP